MQHKTRWRAVVGSSFLTLLFFLVFTFSIVSAAERRELAGEGPSHGLAPGTIADDWFYPFELNGVADWGEVAGVGEFNGDGRADVAVAGCYTSCSLHILWQDSAGALVDSGLSYTYVTAGESDMVVADLNHDGQDDIVLGHPPDGLGIGLFYQGSNGQFTASTYPAAYSPEAVIAGDFDGDGRMDLATGSAGAIGIILQDDSGSLLTPTYWSAPTRGVEDMVAGDFNGDGRADVATSYWAYGLPAPPIALFYQNAAGGFDGAIEMAVGEASGADGLTAGEVNGDGLDDLLVQTVDGLWVFEQGSEGLPETPRHYDSFCNPSAIRVGDVSGDGLNDVLALGDGCTDAALFLQREEDHTLAPFETYPIAYGGSFTGDALAVGDINDDGRTDAAVAVRYNGLALLYHSVPDFGIALQPASQVRPAGSAGISLTAVITGLYNFTGTVTLNTSALPAGASHSLAPGPYAVPSEQTFTVDTSGLAASLAPYTVEVTGSGSGQGHAATANFYLQHRVFLPAQQLIYGPPWWLAPEG
jgi:hypothetical protein